ncbi:MAG: hypothetical protein ACI9YH_004157 [Colwellia sp.]|jgi:hypothetical protein
MNKDKAASGLFFYVQDERYVVLPWIAKSDDVQDERSWPFLGIHAFSALVLPARHFSSRQTIYICVHTGNGAITGM